MAEDYTTTKRISSIKQRGKIPTNQETYENADFLVVMNDVIRDYIVPLILRARSEFFVTETETTIGSTTTFAIPTRAVGVKLRDVLIKNTDDNVFSLALIEPEDLERFNNTSNNYGDGFYLESDDIKIVGEYSANDSIVLKYFRRPNRLILSSDAALVSSVSGNVATCSSVPSTWDIDDTFDVIKGTPHFKTRGDDQEISAITTGTSGTITFSSIPDDVAAGDYICLAGESPIPQIPYDLYPLFEMKCAAIILDDIGDYKGADAKERRVQEKLENVQTLLNDRVEGENRKIVNIHNLAWKGHSGW